MSKMSKLEKQFTRSFTVDCDEYVISKSKRRTTTLCVVSRGVAYSMPGSTRIEVTAETIRFNLEGFRFIFNTPPDVAKKVAAWDDGKELKPFKFRLEKPKGVMPVENRPPRSYKARTGPNKMTGVPRCTRQKSRRWHGFKVRREIKVIEKKAA